MKTSIGRQRAIFAVCCTIALFLPATIGRADFIAGSAAVPAAGVFQLEIAGPLWGVVGAIPSGTVMPRYPGSLGLLSGDPLFGTTTGFLSTSWDFSATTPSVFIPNSPPASSTTFLSQTIPPPPLPGPEPGLATFHADFEATFSLDAGGLSAHSIGIGYQLFMIVDGLVAFDAVIDYTSSTAGLVESLAIHFSRTTPGGFITTVSDTGSLPDLPGLSTLTLSGYFQLKVDDEPGGSSTEIDVHRVPEPSTLLLACLGIVTGLGFWRRKS
jgi:PEP-CTERM motif